MRSWLAFLGVALLCAGRVDGQSGRAHAEVRTRESTSGPGGSEEIGPARHLVRYKQMLERNPVEGAVLDRLWDAAAADREALLLSYRDRAAKGEPAASLIYAHLLRKAGRIEEAVEAYKAAAAANPADATPLLSLGKMRFEKNQPSEAAAAFEAALALLPPRDPRTQHTLLSLGESWLKAEAPGKAGEVWERAIAMDPGNLELRRQLAALCEKNGLPERAIEHHTEIARTGSPEQKANATLALARLFEARGDSAKALDVLQRGLEVTAADNWLHAELLTRFIAVHRNSGTLDSLEKTWTDAARRNEKDPALLSRLIAFYRETGNGVLELRWLDKALELNPRDGVLLRRAAALAAKTGNPAQAADLGRRLLDLDPGNLDAAFFVAEIELRRNETAAAELVVTKLIEEHDSDENLAQAARFFLRHRMWTAAETVLRRAAERQPPNPEAVRELAEYYFDRTRPEEGLRAVQRLVDPQAGLEEQAAQLGSAAEFLGSKGHLEQAAKLLEKAVALSPSPALRNELATALAASGKRDEAGVQLRKAIDETKDPARQEELDRALYAMLVSAPTEAKPESITVPGLGDVPLGSTRPSDVRRLLHPGAAAEMQARKDAVAKAPTPRNVLALARWQALCRQHKEALKTARSITPATPEVTEFIARTAAEGGFHDEAILAVRELAKSASPDERPGLERRVAQILMDAGRLDEGVEAYKALVAADPDVTRSLSDLAEALQRAGRWQDAIEVWQSAFSRSRPGDREVVLKSYARALTQLGRATEALDLIDAELTAIQDESRKERLFQEALQFARRNDLAEAYRQKWQQRVAANPEDVFARGALALILKRSGEERAAYNLLSMPSSRAETPAELRRKADAAAEFGDFQTAIETQKQLLAASDTVEERMRLAAFQEAWFDLSGASATWISLSEQEPRNVDVLLGAAAFFEMTGDELRRTGMLRRAVAVDPNHIAAQFQLGVLLRDRGDAAEAEAAFEKVLEGAAQLSQGFEAPVVPPPQVLAALPAVLAAAETSLTPLNAELGSKLRDMARRSPAGSPVGSERAWRLASIQALSGIKKRDPAQLDEWLARWKRPGAGAGALHAFHYSGADAETHEAWLRLLEESDSDETRLCLVWSALDRKDYTNLGSWVRTLDEPARRQFALLAVGASAIWHGTVPEKLVEAVLPEDFRVRETLWQAALILAGSGNLDGAVALGRRAEGAELPRRDTALAVALWEAAAGRTGKAVALLESAMNSPGPRALSAPSFSALRARFLIEHPEEAATFANQHMEATHTEADPVRGTEARLLLAALADDREATDRAARDFVAAQPLGAGAGSALGAGSSPFSLLLTAALTLREWDLPRAAAKVLDAALADQARLSLLDESARVEAEQARLLKAALELAATPVAKFDDVLALHSQKGQDWFQALAAQLDAMQRPEAAGKIYARLMEQDRKNENLFRASVLGLANGGLLDEARELFANTIASGEAALPENAIPQIAAALAEALDARGDKAGAVMVLDRALKKQPRDIELRRKLAGMVMRNGELERAVDLLSDTVRSDPGDWPSRMLLAEAFDGMARYEDALRALGFELTPAPLPSASLPPAAAAVAARIRIQRGEALQVAESRRALLREGAGEVLAGAGRSIAGAGRLNDALAFARLCLMGAPAEQVLPHLGVILDLIASNDSLPGGLLSHWLMKGRVMASNPGGSPQAEFILMVNNLALSHPARAEFREFLARTCEDGQLLWHAGRVITALQALEDTPRLERFVKALSSNPVQRPENLQEAAAALHAIGRHDDAVNIARRLVELRPTETGNLLGLALALHRAGKELEAATMIDRAWTLAAFDPSAPGRIGLCFLEMKNAGEAERALDVAAKRDPMFRRAWSREALARVRMEKGDEEGAAEILAEHCTHDLASEFAVRFAQVSGLDAVARRFGLGPAHLDAMGVNVLAVLLREARTAEALEFARTKPRLLCFPGAPLEEFARAAKGKDAAALAGLLELALAEQPSWPTRAALARLYAAMAAANPDQGLDWLARAEELLPQELAFARGRAELLFRAGRKADGVAVLAAYASRTQSPAWKAEAERLKAAIGRP